MGAQVKEHREVKLLSTYPAAPGKAHDEHEQKLDKVDLRKNSGWEFTASFAHHANFYLAKSRHLSSSGLQTVQLRKMLQNDALQEYL